MNEKKKMKGLPKRILSFVLTLVMVITLIPMTPVMAESGEVIIGNFKYQLNPTDRTATLTGCNFLYTNEEITEINISTVEYEGVTYTVTAVGEWAVSDSEVLLGEDAEYYEHITSVSLPNVTTIGDHAFHFCFGMTSLNLPKVKQIGVSSFGYCEALSSIYLPEVESIAESGFAYNAALTNIDMPKVVTVGNNAFKDCSSLETLDLPEATSIGEEAFSGCWSLTSATLPKVTSLSGGVFNMCMSLQTISMPEVIGIGEAAFGACFNITEVSFPKLENLGDVAFDSCSGITSISIPSLSTIQEYSLMGIEDASLTLPDTWLEDDRPVLDSDAEKFFWKEGWFNEVNYVHVHNWTYAASNGVLTATCSRDNTHTAALTLTISDENYSGMADIITVGTLEEQAAWTEARLTIPTVINYEKEDGTSLGTTAPTTVGSYVAKVSPVGEIASDSNTAKVLYTIVEAPPSFEDLANDLKYDGTLVTLEKDYKRMSTEGEIHIDAGTVNIDLNGHTIDGATTYNDYGAIFVVGEDCELIISDSSDNKGVITGGTGTKFNNKEGGAIFNEGKVTINGGKFTGNRTGYGSVISNHRELTINGGIFIDNSAEIGGVIHNDHSGKVTITGGEFINNTGRAMGGVLNNYSVAVITGGTFSGNKSSYGGVVEFYNGVSLTINGGTFTNNTASESGGAIDCDGGLLCIGGSAVIKDNKKNGNANNIEFVSGTVTLSDTPLTSEAEIYVTISASTDTLIASGATLDTVSHFKSDDDTKMFVLDNGAIKFGTKAGHVHSGGTANCKAKAMCQSCGQFYGDFGAHDFRYSANGNVLTATCSTDETHKVSLTLSASDANYSGNAVIASFNDNDKTVWGNVGLNLPTITYEYKATQGGTYESTTEAKNVGFYKASVTVEGATAYVEYEITKAEPAISRNPEAATNLKYTGSVQNLLSTTPASDDTTSIKYYVSTTNTTPVETSFNATTATATNAGTYYVYYLLVSDANHSNKILGPVEVSIGKETPTVTKPTASAITYGQSLANSNLTGGEASVDGTFSWNDDSTLPSVSDSNATNYKVVFTPNDTKNYETKEFDLTLTVNQKELTNQTVSISSTTSTYNGSPVKQTVEVKDGNTTLTEGTDYEVSGDKEKTNVGNYTLKVTFKGNYKGTVDKNWAITKASLSNPSVTLNGWTYGQTANDPQVSNNTGNANVIYSYKVKDAEDTTYTSTKPENAGTYTVKAVIADSANYQGTTVTSNFTIAKASLSNETAVTLTGWTYGENANDPTVSNNTSGGTVTYLYKVKDAADTTYTSTKATNAGNYTVKATIAETDNYEGKAVTTDFTIAKANTSASDFTLTPPSSLVYDGQAKKAKVTNDKVTNIQVKYYKDGIEVENPTNVGTYTVKVTASAGTNYNAVTTLAEVGTFEITAKDISSIAKVAVDKTVFTYDGTAKTADVEVYLDEEVLDSKYYTVTNNSKTDVGEYELTVSFKDNYKGEIKMPWLITKAETESIKPDGYTGDLTVTVTKEEAAPTISATIPSNILSTTELDDIKDGSKDIDIILTLKNKTVDDLTEGSKEAIEDKGINLDNLTFLDIALDKVVKIKTNGIVVNTETEAITETESLITITIDVPKSIDKVKSGYKRVYTIIRSHKNADNTYTVDKLDATYSGDKLTFKTDKFSDYAVSYVDTLIPTPANPGSSPRPGYRAPNTGVVGATTVMSSNGLIEIGALVVGSVIGLISIKKKKRK